jgi:hypothetical protein
LNAYSAKFPKNAEPFKQQFADVFGNFQQLAQLGLRALDGGNTNEVRFDDCYRSPVGAGVTVGESHDRDRDRDRTVVKEREPDRDRTTVIKKEHPDGDESKTVIHHDRD